VAVYDKYDRIIVMNSRFVILTHDHPMLHWDLMLEEAESLRTWRLLSEPNSTNPIPAEALPAHRKHYLTYEGPVSGDRGTVTHWDSGTYVPLSASGEHLRVGLEGSRLRGVIEQFYFRFGRTIKPFYQQAVHQS
jgi:hypothetical protein